MKLTAIAAVGKNRELGLQNDMPWGRSLKGDLRFFREKTMGHPVVMGRKTFDSLPKPFPGRTNLVITSRPGTDSENIKYYPNVESFKEDWKDYPGEIFVTGGASVYSQLLPDTDRIYLTEINKNFPADTFFPWFDRHAFERTILDSTSESGFSYSHVLYERKK